MAAEGISKSYGERTLFENLDIAIQRGDRVGIIGPNGCGKTTLAHCLLGEVEPDAGTVRLGSRLQIGYYRQLQEHLDLSLTVWQYLQSVVVSLDGQARASEQQARDLAGAFLFSGSEQDKILGELSGGERSRAVLAGLVAGARNLLVLDEPSNHLDIPSAERLETALSADGGYEGTLLLISHDRALIEATCAELIIFEGQGMVERFRGKYSEWELRQKENVPRRSTPDISTRNVEGPKKRRLSEPKVSRNPLASLRFTDLESRIEQLETRVREIDLEMMNPAVYSDGEACRALQSERARCADELTPLEEEWSRRAEKDGK